MNCERVVELLPWLLNGTLAPPKRADVAAHLAECEACREELEQTAQVWADTREHLPAETIADYGLGLDLGGFPRTLFEEHLASCQNCRNELELVGDPLEDDRRSDGYEIVRGPQDVRGTAVRGSPPAPARGASTSWAGWQPLALAASMLVVSLLSIVIWQSARPPAPHANLDVLEILPADATTRGDSSSIPEIPEIPRGGPVALLLIADREAPSDSYRAILRSPEGRLLWSLSGLELSDRGDFAVLLPTEDLPEGRLTLEVEALVEDDWESAARYELRLDG